MEIKETICDRHIQDIYEIKLFIINLLLVRMYNILHLIYYTYIVYIDMPEMLIF